MPCEFKLEEDYAIERSTVRIEVSFYDSRGNLQAPNPGTIKWTLTDLKNEVINNREQQPIASANTIDIVLTGPDLMILDAESNNPKASRILTIQAEYDSDYGIGLSLNDQIIFNVKNLSYIDNT